MQFSQTHACLLTTVSSDSVFQLVFVEFIIIILLSLLVQWRNGKKKNKLEAGEGHWNEREKLPQSSGNETGH